MNVVCIDDRPPPGGWGSMMLLVRGMVYTVEGICPHKHVSDEAVLGGYLLVGNNAPTESVIENGFVVTICNCYLESRFRPVRETSIESLKLICEPVA